MSEAIEDYMALKSIRNKVREYFGVKCCGCLAKRPKAQPKILLPGQLCRACGTRDTRPDLTNSDYEKIGISRKIGVQQ